VSQSKVYDDMLIFCRSLKQFGLKIPMPIIPLPRIYDSLSYIHRRIRVYVCRWIDPISWYTISLFIRAIHTYQNRGTTAPHPRAQDHVVIYTGEKPPPLVDGEDRVILNRTPIKVTLDIKGEALRSTARLSLAKLHTVEHTTPVAIIGKIAPRDLDRVRQYCDEVQGLSSSSDGASQLLVDVEEEDEEE
jgi:hypothetical protein